MSDLEPQRTPVMQDTSASIQEWLRQQHEAGKHTLLVLQNQELGDLPEGMTSAAWTDATSEAPAQPTVFVVSTDSEVPSTSPRFDAVYCASLPSSVALLQVAAQHCTGEIFLSTRGTVAESQTVAQQDQELALRTFIVAQAQQSEAPYFYASSAALLQAMGLPRTSQPELERSLRQLEASLAQLQQEGVLLACTPVHFQLHIHNASGFNEKGVAAHEEAKKFWQAFEALHAKLSPLESIKFKLLPGRDIDLRELSAMLGTYSVAELNALFTALDEAGIVASTQSITHEQEYQLQPKAVAPPSRALLYWSQTGEKRGLLLAHLSQLSDATALTTALQSGSGSVEAWGALWSLFEAASSDEDKATLAAQVLRQFEASETQAAMLVWEWLCASWSQPGLDKDSLQSLLPTLPETEAGTEALQAPLRFLLQTRKSQPTQEVWLDYALKLPQTESWSELHLPFLERRAAQALKQDPKKRIPAWFKRFVALGKQKAESSEHPSWGPAMGWALHVLDQSDEALPWFGNPEDLGPRAAWRFVQVAESQQKTLEAIDVLAKRGKSLHASPRVKADIAQSLQQQLARRIHTDFKDKETSWLRDFLAPSHPAHHPKVKRAILRQLADRKEASREELAEIAKMVERDGDWKRALAYRQQLQSQNADDVENLQGLARIAFRRRQIKEGLTWALDAAHKEPRKAPLGPFLDEYKEYFFADLTALREALIELPAHPALSALEQECTRREQALRELTPVLEATETLLQEEKYTEAQRKAREAIAKEPDFAPVRFKAIVREVDNKERELRRRMQRLPRKDPKKRNKLLEDIQEQAKKFGFTGVAQEALERLVKLNPHYGLGHIKLARQSKNIKQQEESFQQAIRLARSIGQRKRNIDEYAVFLKGKQRLAELGPLLLELLPQDSEHAEDYERLLVRVVEKEGDNQTLTKAIDAFMGEHGAKFPLKRVHKTLKQFESLDPWKRALLSIKTQKSSTRKGSSKKA